MVDTDVSGGTPGYRLHGNPMYAGRTLAFFQAELAAVMIGAAKGALDEYEEILRTRKTQRPPIVTRTEDPDYQRWFGLAIGQLAAAEATLLQAAEQWHRALPAQRRGRAPRSRARTTCALNIIAREALTLAWDAMQGRSSAPPARARRATASACERIFRDMAMGWGHFGQIVGDWAAREWSREHLGLVEDVLKPDRLHRS